MIFALRMDTALKTYVISIVVGVHVVPPFTVCSIFPKSPTAQPVLTSLKETAHITDPENPLVCGVHVCDKEMLAAAVISRNMVSEIRSSLFITAP